jgi:hypothetical protein
MVLDTQSSHCNKTDIIGARLRLNVLRPHQALGPGLLVCHPSVPGVAGKRVECGRDTLRRRCIVTDCRCPFGWWSDSDMHLQGILDRIPTTLRHPPLVALLLYPSDAYSGDFSLNLESIDLSIGRRSLTPVPRLLYRRQLPLGLFAKTIKI